MNPTYITLFSCAGVGCYGFKMNGFDCIASNELLQPRIEVQRVNHKCKYDSGYKCRERFQWAYINYIRTKDYIFMPALSKNADCIEDTTVRRQFELRFQVYPRENIIPIYALEALKQERGLHCCSWNILK